MNLLRIQVEYTYILNIYIIEPIRKDTLWEEICKLEEFSTEEWARETKFLLERVYYPLKNIFLLTSNSQLNKSNSREK